MVLDPQTAVIDPILTFRRSRPPVGLPRSSARSISPSEKSINEAVN
jgi:hypothetical protein